MLPVSELKIRDLVRALLTGRLPTCCCVQANVHSRLAGRQADHRGTRARANAREKLSPSPAERAIRARHGANDASISSSQLVQPLSRLLYDVQIDCLHGLDASAVETIIFKEKTDFPQRQLLNTKQSRATTTKPVLVGPRRLGAMVAPSGQAQDLCKHQPLGPPQPHAATRSISPRRRAGI
jgi:hypothetical protein